MDAHYVMGLLHGIDLGFVLGWFGLLIAIRMGWL